MAGVMAGKSVILDGEGIGKQGSDADMDHRAGVKRAPPVEADSPSKQRAAQVTVDIETLRGLLAEQSAALLDKVMLGQRRQMQDLAGELRGEIKQSEDSVRADVRAQAGELAEMKQEQSSMAMRLQKLEAQGSGSTASMSTVMDSTTAERHRFTLIFGGWPRDSQRKVICDQLHQSLIDLGVARLTDNPAFCTGPRRSMSLLQFKIRSPQEDFAGMRDRMSRVVNAVNQGNITLRGGKKLWSGYSKPRHERERGAHGALLRRVLRCLDSTQEEFLEVEYATGSGWLHDSKLASAVTDPDNSVDGKHEFVRFDALTPGGVSPWIDATALARELKVDVGAVKDAIKEQQRR